MLSTDKDTTRRFAELESELAVCRAEREKGLAREAAMAEVLQVINSSQTELRTVFDTILERAMWLCEAAFGELRTYDGDRFHSAAIRGVPAAFAEFRKHNAAAAGPGSLGARVLEGQHIVHVLDLKDEESYRAGDINRRGLVDLGGARTALVASLRKAETVLGFIILYRQDVRPFNENQIALLQTFATQAVIAMENARLITETRESLEQQTATAEVLGSSIPHPGILRRCSMRWSRRQYACARRPMDICLRTTVSTSLPRPCAAGRNIPRTCEASVRCRRASIRQSGARFAASPSCISLMH